MSELSKKRPAEPNLSSIEGNLFGALFSFHKELLDLMRQSSLDDEKLNLVADRIKTSLAEITADMERTQNPNVADRLEAAYDEPGLFTSALCVRHCGEEGCAESGLS